MYDLILIERQGKPGNTIAQHLRVRGEVARWKKGNQSLEPPQYREQADGLVQAYWEFETEEDAVMFKLMWYADDN